MGIIDPLWDTANNRGLGSSATPVRTGQHVLDSANDVTRDGIADGPQPTADEGLEPQPVMGSEEPDPTATLLLMKSAFAQGKSYLDTVLQGRWSGAYNAWNNKHSADSKYTQARFRGRSKLYRPKTRSTVRKKAAEAASALFSTSDAVIIEAGDASDEKQLASAAIIQELLNFRLARSSENAGIPWFVIAVGAHMTAQITALCVSKQYWEYKTQDVQVQEQTFIDVMGMQIPQMQTVTRQKVVRDRPQVRLYPPENVIRDPGAGWENQAQDASYLILQNPMSLSDARVFLAQQNPHSAVRFHDVSDAELMQAMGSSTGDNASAAIARRAREQSGNDRFSDQSVDKEYETVWLHENFMRIKGRDHVFWSLGTSRIISNIVPVQEAYPEQNGARPVTIGFSSLEPFKIDPMAPVAAWQPVQQEINDLVNLRLDTVKQTIAPLTIVRRSRSVDIRAIQNRSPDSVAYVQDIDDVKFDRPGDVGQSSYVEMERLNADFDDSAGAFSLGSVQTNRSLNETVGGMNLISGNANAMGEFDLRVWIETWVEPTLRQVVKLEQFYESDANIIAIAAGKADLFQKFRMNEVTDEMLSSQVTVTVNVGLGSADPMQSMQKFGAATEIAGNMLGPSVGARANADAVIDEVYGKAGFKNASKRFFKPGEDQNPELQQAKQAMQQMQQQLQQMQQKLDDKEGDLKSKEADRQNKLDIARMQLMGNMASKEMAHGHQTERDLQQLQQAPDAQPTQPGAPQSIHQLLGLQPPDNSQNEMLAQSMQQGFQVMAQAFMRGLQQIAVSIEQSNAQTAQLLANGHASVADTMNRSTREHVNATRELTKAIRAPKKVIRNADGFADSVVAQ